MLTDKADKTIPKYKAWSFLTFPVGIGLKQVLDINLSRSASYHIFKAPAAPAPNVTKPMLIIASKIGIWFGAVSNPTAQVKITKDITLGFIRSIKPLNSLISPSRFRFNNELRAFI